MGIRRDMWPIGIGRRGRLPAGLKALALGALLGPLAHGDESPALELATPSPAPPSNATTPASDDTTLPTVAADALPGPAPEVEELADGRLRVGRVDVDPRKKTITIPAAVHMDSGAVEYVLVTRKGKVHEAVFVTDADPSHIHIAALLLGIKPEANLGPEQAAAKLGAHGAVEAWIEWDRNGPPARLALTDTVAIDDPVSGRPATSLAAGLWLYNGSRVVHGSFLAATSGSIISIIRDPEALINNPGASRDNDEIHVPNAARLPKLQTPVRIVLRVR